LVRLFRLVLKRDPTGRFVTGEVQAPRCLPPELLAKRFPVM